MMESLLRDLSDWGVPDGHIFKEAFGPASGKAIKKKKEPVGATAAAASVQVTFSRSDKTCDWNDSFDSLLDCAEQNGVTIDSGCQAGSCGTCIAAVKEGEFDWVNEPSAPIEDGSCLTCIAVPKGNIVIDA